MPKIIQIAAIQMKATPAPIKERLAKAENFILQCAQAGAQIVVLPEVFNTGYEYCDENYLRAESFHDLTANWMRSTAAHYGVHLAGTFLRREQTSIFNTMLLVAPDGRQWHYDKNYPWVWERAYFQKGTNITVADTPLGKIGFLICFDVAHSDLWRRYAGKVEFMLVSSCPPKALDLSLALPDGKKIMARNTGPLVQYLKRTSDETFGQYVRDQAGFLGVPVVQATSTGNFTSSIPAPKLSLMMLALIYPPVWKYKSRFDQVRMKTGYFNETFIADASGTVLQRVPAEVEGYVLDNVSLPDSPPQPKRKQPSSSISKFAYVLDTMANMMFASEYERKVQEYLR
ncbi:MAG: carbon-nitrogen hydrolase family protein [Chloroflexota bacterium]